MASKTLNTRIINKHAVEADWNKAINFIPKQAELIIYDIDENYSYERFKIGDGITPVIELPFSLQGESGVGKKTTESGEIFNDYKNNQAGKYAHAEGCNTKASGMYSHAEGNMTKATGSESHAEGHLTDATGSGSHAEGSGSKASGEDSHAEGGFTRASGKASHAEGYGAAASGKYSHAGGY